jgi:hypothetical protein
VLSFSSDIFAGEKKIVNTRGEEKRQRTEFKDAYVTSKLSAKERKAP